MKVDNPTALLAAREEELAAIYENVPGIVFYIAVETDGEFRFLSVSRNFLTATGLSRDQVVGSLVREVIPPPSRDMVLSRYREAIRSGQQVRWEEKSLYPAGQRYGEVAVTPLLDASGRATHLIGIVHDITERKRLEEKRAEDLLEAAPDAMVVVDQAGRMILANAQTERLFGYRRGEILGQNVELLMPQRFHERHEEHRTSFFSQPRIRPMGASLQLSGLRKDGTEFPVEVHLSPMQTPDGILVTSAIRDISERKIAEDSRLKLATIVESSDDAIVSGTLDGVIVSWNAGAQRMYGYTEAEAVGRPVSMLVPTELGDEEIEISETLKAGNRIEQLETVRVAKDGKRINVSLTISPITDSTGKVVGVSGIARDITERKRAEEALRESEEKFRSVFREAGVGMVIVSLEGRYLAANAAFCQCLGYTEEELLARTVESITFPDDWPDFSRKLQDSIAGEHGFQWLEKRCLHKSGRVVYTESSTSLIRNRNGEPQYLVAEVLDVTKRKEAEEFLSGMSRKLIEAQEQERSRIGRELHDDINQRLAMMGVEIDQVQENPSEVQNRLRDLRRRISELSNDVQALSHELHSSKLEILGAVRGIRSWCKEFGEWQKMQIEFRSDVSSTLPPDIGLCLFRVLQEAAHNAIKHSGMNRMDVLLREESEEIQLIVSDSGKGFDLETMGQGKGLGLTSMRERIRLVNGTITIDSKPMGGTTIYVRVPLKSEKVAQRHAS